jgi:hypothetical protein
MKVRGSEAFNAAFTFSHSTFSVGRSMFDVDPISLN